MRLVLNQTLRDFVQERQGNAAPVQHHELPTGTRTHKADLACSFAVISVQKQYHQNGDNQKNDQTDKNHHDARSHQLTATVKRTGRLNFQTQHIETKPIDGFLTQRKQRLETLSIALNKKNEAR